MSHHWFDLVQILWKFQVKSFKQRSENKETLKHRNVHFKTVDGVRAARKASRVYRVQIVRSDEWIVDCASVELDLTVVIYCSAVAANKSVSNLCSEWGLAISRWKCNRFNETMRTTHYEQQWDAWDYERWRASDEITEADWLIRHTERQWHTHTTDHRSEPIAHTDHLYNLLPQIETDRLGGDDSGQGSTHRST